MMRFSNEYSDNKHSQTHHSVCVCVCVCVYIFFFVLAHYVIYPKAVPVHYMFRLG
jgi:hypothetical protein